MTLTPTERELIRVSNSRELYKPDYDGLGEWVDAYVPIFFKVQADRAAAGLMSYPNPPIPIPPKNERFGALMMKHFSDPNYEKLTIEEQDARLSNLCALQGILDLLASPGFDSLSPKEQTAALFDRWPESQT